MGGPPSRMAEASAAKRRFFSMRGRRCRASRTPAARRYYSGKRSRCRAAARFVNPRWGTPGPWRPKLQLRRSRVGRPKWRDDLRVVPSLRRAAPSTRSVRIPDEGGSSLCAARLGLGKPPQKWDDTEVVPPSFEGRCRVSGETGKIIYFGICAVGGSRGFGGSAV
jgi:hypothetical protein